MKHATSPDFMDLFSFADCAARVLQETRKLDSVPLTALDRKVRRILIEPAVRSLRFVARHDPGLAACRVAVWRGKTDKAYLNQLGQRLRAHRERALDAK